MKKIIDRLINNITLLITIYTIGVLIGGLLYLLRALGRIRISHWERFPHRQGNLIVVSNHPSLVEPILLPALFFREYFFHPFKFSPWSTPDKTNYYNRWYWFWLRPRAIPIDRDNKQVNLKAFFRMRKILNSGRILILFPEAGRTFKGKEFLYSKNGKKIRMLKAGISWLIIKTEALVLPVWVEGTDNVLPNSPDKLYHCFPKLREKVTIKIGQTLKFKKTDNREEVIQKLAATLLSLADEPCAF